jgi:methyl-accepting chemotaxis protein
VTQAAHRVRETREAANNARGTILDTNTKAVEGAKIVSEAGTAMGQIEQSSGQITNIIGVIDSIAFQTNLLALNAGVEAARAGESGKGFAVVASEVRALAQRCSDAADEIKSLITGTSAHVAAGVDLVRRSGKAFDEIAEAVAVLTRSIESIATATNEQAEGLSQIETVVGDLDQSTQQNAAMAEQSTAAATSLAQEADTLRDTVSAFQVDALHPSTAIVRHHQPQARRPLKSVAHHASAPSVRGNLALKPTAHATAQEDDWSEF